MQIHSQGRPIIIKTAIILILLNLLIINFVNLSFTQFTIPVFISIIIFIGIILFFRNPERQYNLEENYCFSPADGTIIEIKEIYEHEYFNDEMLKISIFMSIFNVHLNRVPIDGKVAYQKYHPGAHYLAFHPKSSEKNEHNSIVFLNSSGIKIMTRQIAGGVARRIVSFVNDNQEVKATQEMGFIKFGSRVDVFMPKKCSPQIVLNQKVKAGITVLAKLN